MQVSPYRVGHYRKAFIAALFLQTMVGGVHAASAQNLLINGNFETGTFAGWTIATSNNPDESNPSSRNFYLSTPGENTSTSNGNVAFATAPNPSGGSFYAVSNANLPGQSALYQSFLAPVTGRYTYSFQFFANEQSGLGSAVSPSGLDYTTSGTFDDNQHARIDLLNGILSPGSAFSTASSDINTTLFAPGITSTTDGNGNVIPASYTTMSGSFNLVAGNRYTLRFAEVDNLSALNLGVDNVAITGPVIIPECPTGIFVFSVLPILGAIMWKKKQRICFASGRLNQAKNGSLIVLIDYKVQ